MTDNLPSFTFGDRVFVQGLSTGDKFYVFHPLQMEFLLSLQKLKNVHASAISVGKTEEWARAFLSSRKFKSYLSSRMNQFAARGALTVEWWYEFGKRLAEGRVIFYEGTCEFCAQAVKLNAYEAESFRQDDMTLGGECPACYKPMELAEKVEPFMPSREQVVGWQELGQRLIPKIERVHHVYDNSEIVFESEAGQ